MAEIKQAAHNETKAPNGGAKKGRAAVPENETKSDKFKRLGGIRLNNACATLERVAQIADKTSYEYTDVQRDKVLSELQKRMDLVRASFSSGKTPAKSGITL
jgi:hypothetical protein